MIREVDLGEATFRERGEFRTWSPISTRAWLYNQRLLTYSPFPLKEIVVDEEKIEKAIRWSEIITRNEKIKTLISLFHETYTYLMNTEYKQALVMGWIILEDFHIKDLWLSHIGKITLDKDRLSKLASWNVDQRIETLHISHIITDAEYNLLMEIKNARNEVVHEGKTPRKEIVEKCLKLVSNVAQKYIGDYVGTKLSEL